MGYRLTAEQIEQNYEDFLKIIDSFEDRADKLRALYDSFGERLLFEPASSMIHFHNAIPGGYIDHVLRVCFISEQLYHKWKDLGMYVENFTLEELKFAALNHDLGKLGFSGDVNGQYVPNPSKWHVQNQGRVYAINPNIPFLMVPDRSLFLLQSAGIQISLNEYLGIRIHDGVYEDANKPYFFASSKESKLRCNLPIILHEADMMASLKEREMWNDQDGLVPTNMSYPVKSDELLIQQKEEKEKKKEQASTVDFDKLFADL